MRVTGLLAPQNTFLDTIATRFDGSHSNFVLGNAAVEQYPIVYCSDGFCDLTGYLRVQIMQRSAYCKFLYGKSTDKVEKCKFRTAMQQKNEFKGVLLLYNKANKPFYCLLDVVPIKNDLGEIVLFLVSFKDITLEKTKEMKFSGITFPPDFPQCILDSVNVEEDDTIHAKRFPLDYKGNENLEFMNRKNEAITPYHTANRSGSDLSGRKDSLAPINHGRLRARNTLTRASIKLRSLTLDRRRSRAVLYNLNVLAEKSNNKPTRVRKNWNVSGINTNNKFQKQIPEYKMATMEHSVKYIIFHYSNIKILWDMLIMIATLYVACVVPYYAAFADFTEMKSLNEIDNKNIQLMKNQSYLMSTIEPDTLNATDIFSDEKHDIHGSITLLWWDIVAEILFIIDVILNFRTTFVSGSGQVVFKPRDIATHYLRTWFMIDVVAALPLDSILKFLEENQNRALKQIQLLKIVRLLRLAKIFHKIETLNTYGFVALLLCVVIFFIIAHWAACLWFWIGYNGLSQEVVKLTKTSIAVAPEKMMYDLDLTVSMSWLVKLAEDLSTPYSLKQLSETTRNQLKMPALTTMANSLAATPQLVLVDGPTQSQYYTSSLYFTLSSLTSVGFGNIAPNTDLEKKFAIAIMFVGALLHAVVFGHVSSIIQRMHAKSSNFDVKISSLKEFIRIHHMPRTLKNRIMEYHQAIWSNHNGIDPKEMLREFPEKLQAEVSLHLYRDVFNLPVFQNASKGCLRFLSLHVKETFVVPGEYLIHHGDPLNAIYLVVSGSLEVIQSQNYTKSNIVAILGKGDLFGLSVTCGIDFDDDTPVKEVKSTCDVKALSYCVLQCVSKTGVEKMLTIYPEYRHRFSRDLMADYSCSLWSTNEDDLSSSDEAETMDEKENVDSDSGASYALVPAVTVCSKPSCGKSTTTAMPSISSLLGGATLDLLTTPVCNQSSTNSPKSSNKNSPTPIENNPVNTNIIYNECNTVKTVPQANMISTDLLKVDNSNKRLPLGRKNYKNSIVVRKKQILESPVSGNKHVNLRTSQSNHKKPLGSDSALYGLGFEKIEEEETENDCFLAPVAKKIKKNKRKIEPKSSIRHSYHQGLAPDPKDLNRKVRFNENVDVQEPTTPILKKSESSNKLLGMKPKVGKLNFYQRPSQIAMVLSPSKQSGNELLANTNQGELRDESLSIGSNATSMSVPLATSQCNSIKVISEEPEEGIIVNETVYQAEPEENLMGKETDNSHDEIFIEIEDDNDGMTSDDILDTEPVESSRLLEIVEEKSSNSNRLSPKVEALNLELTTDDDLSTYVNNSSRQLSTMCRNSVSPQVTPIRRNVENTIEEECSVFEHIPERDEIDKKKDMSNFLSDCLRNTPMIDEERTSVVPIPVNLEEKTIPPNRIASVMPHPKEPRVSSVSAGSSEISTENSNDTPFVRQYASLAPPLSTIDQRSERTTMDSGIHGEGSPFIQRNPITQSAGDLRPSETRPLAIGTQLNANSQNNFQQQNFNQNNQQHNYHNYFADSNQLRSLSLQFVQMNNSITDLKKQQSDRDKSVLDWVDILNYQIPLKRKFFLVPGCNRPFHWTLKMIPKISSKS